MESPGIELDSAVLFASHFALAQVCQVAVCEVLLRWRSCGADAISPLFRDVPPSKTYGEAIAAADLLARFVRRLGDELHRQADPACKRKACRLAEQELATLQEIDPDDPQRWNAGSAVRSWLAAYDAALIASHPRIIATRAQMRLNSTAGHPKVRDLARELGCSVPVLYRRLKEEGGESPRQHRTRLRVIQAIECLRTTSWSTEAIALEVGWKSKKDLFRAVSRLTGVTPARIRTLTQGDAAALVARLSLPSAPAGPVAASQQ